jgi:hypothetical protein
MIKFIKKWWNGLVTSLDEPLVLTKSMQVKPKSRKRFKKVKRLRINQR